MRAILRRPSAAALLLLFAACSGMTARQQVLLPALRAAWSDMLDDVNAGIESHLMAGTIVQAAADGLRNARDEMTAALASGDPDLIRSKPWPALKAEALSGIDAELASHAIGPDVAPSLRMRVTRFDAGLAKYLDRK